MQVPPVARLEYLEQAPKSGPVRQIVVLLHGYGRNAALMQKLADEVHLRLPQAIIFMPHAPEEYEEHVSDDNVLRVPEQLRGDDPGSFSPGMRRKWFSIAGATLEEVTRRVFKVTDLINDFMSEKMTQYNLQDQDVALMGFSQGGVVALYTAYHRPRSIACVVGHSTIFMQGMDLQSKPPTLYLYGLDDEEFPPQRYETAAAFVKAHVPDTTVRAVEGLRHTTNAESRAIVADFIADHFK